MLTTDLALVNDNIYYDIVGEFANDINTLKIQFGAVWEKLITNGGVWTDNKMCVNSTELEDTRCVSIYIRFNDVK